MKGILVVRKYKNRRLYDTDQSKHITREELLEIVRSGRNVQVQEAKTGEDVTVETLLQVLLSETGTSLNSTIPTEFVHFLIRGKQDNLSRFFRDFLPGAMQTFQSSISNLKDQGKRMAEKLFPYPSYNAPWGFPFGQSQQSNQQEPSDSGDEMAEMRERMKELESMLSKIGKKD